MTHDDIDGIRQRPGMYVGDCSEGWGLHQLIWELLGNAIDQHLAGQCTQIEVELGEDGSAAVRDDGPGISLDEVDGVSFAQLALTRLHHTPTMDGHAPHEHLSTRGAGLVAVCALSDRLTLEVHRDGRHHAQRFERGRPVAPASLVGPTTRTGTSITIVPDPSIFRSTCFDAGTLSGRLRELAYLLPDLHLRFVDRRVHAFHEPTGLLAYVTSRAQPGSPSPFFVRRSLDTIGVEVALTWGHPWQTSIESFANLQRTTDGGTHVDGLERGLLAAVRAVLPAARSLSESALARALSSGLLAAVCVRLDDPSYGAPTKDRLHAPRVTAIVERVVTDELTRHLEQRAPLRDFIDALLTGT